MLCETYHSRPAPLLHNMQGRYVASQQSTAATDVRPFGLCIKGTGAMGKDIHEGPIRVMSKRSTERSRKQQKSARQCGDMPLVNLIGLVAHDSDERALHEFHQHRTPFRHRSITPLRCAEYLSALREAELMRKDVPTGFSVIVDRAYDLTLAKFQNLPRASAKIEQKNSENPHQLVRWKGPDCRCQFKAFLNAFAWKSTSKGGMNPIEEEELAAQMLQRLVKRHFRLSLRECRRTTNPLVTRYFWKVNDGTICVLMPTHMNGRERRKWLEENADDPCPSRRGEHERVQAIVDRRLWPAKVFELQDDSPEYKIPLQDSVLENITVKGLANAIAQEKADNIEKQRARIKALGKRTLKTMIRRIFRELSEDRYKDADVASDFGLSKATLSRFAGSLWSKSNTGTAGMPDLWRNTANILSSDPTFAEAALDARFRVRVAEAAAGRKCYE